MRNNKTLNYQPENLFVVTGQEEEKTAHDWDGMPEFDQPEAEAWKVLKVRFRNEEDLNEFQKLIDQIVTTRTKSIWHPKLVRGATLQEVWVDEFFDEENTGVSLPNSSIYNLNNLPSQFKIF